MARISQMLARTVEKWPEHPAVVEGNLRWTYAQLASASAALQDRLRNAGLSKGDRVILWLKNGSIYIAAYLAVLGLEGVVVAVYSEAMPAELLKIISHVQASAILTTRPQWEKYGATFGQCGLRFALLPDADVSLGHASRSEPAPEGLAQILYTSGTTGSPKGVMLSHDNLLANVQSILACLPLTPQDSAVAVLPFVFSYGNSVLLTHLFAGAKIICEENLLYAHCVVEAMKRESATGFSGVASHYAFLLRDSGFRSENLPALRYFTSAGGPMPRRLLADVQEAFPRARFHVMYGQTEATARITMLAPQDLDRNCGSAGRAVPGVSLKIVDEAGEPLPAGTPGEITVEGGNIMEGYWHDAAATSARLKHGWLFTGDLGFLDDKGFLYITGRQSEIVKTGGFRVSPEEIEGLLFEHEDVLDVGVAGVEDSALGEVVVAGVVVKPGREFSPKRLMAFCAGRLAPFKRPKAFYRLSKVPRSVNGKIVRRALVEQLCSLHLANQPQPDPCPQTSAS